MALNYSYDTQEEGTRKARNKQDYMITDGTVSTATGYQCLRKKKQVRPDHIVAPVCGYLHIKKI